MTGRILFQGTPPGPSSYSITVDGHICGTKIKSDQAQIGEKGGLANAVVYLHGPIEGVGPYPAPPAGFLIDQAKCRFVPPVLIVAAGQKIKVRNSDPALHNFHTYSTKNRPLNKAQPKTMPEMELQFDRPEFFEVRCDVHSWMQAWIVVAEHRLYALTGPGGEYRLTDIPAGDYTITAWHGTIGQKSRRITVPEGAALTADFKLTAP